MAEMEERMSVLEQMNKVLKESENSLRDREEEVKRRYDSLKELEEKLLLMGDTLQVQKAELDRKEKTLAEKERTLDEYAKTLEESMRKVMEEKLALREVPVVTAPMEWEDEKLLAMSSALGIDGGGINLSPMYLTMEKLVKKKYPSWRILEMTPEHLCIEAADKEIRVFEQEPASEVQVVKHIPGAKSNKQLNTKLTQIARVAPGWSLHTEENQLVCAFHFTKSMTEEQLLSKVRDFIVTHL